MSYIMRFCEHDRKMHPEMIRPVMCWDRRWSTDSQELRLPREEATGSVPARILATQEGDGLNGMRPGTALRRTPSKTGPRASC